MAKRKVLKGKKQRRQVMKSKLTPEQDLFCKYYATERDSFGNGLMSYAQAYDIDLTKRGAKKVAATCAWRLLMNVDVLERIRKYMELGGFNDETVDKELLFLVRQNAELPTKLGAIREYNQLQNRIQKKIDLTSKGQKIGFGLSELLGLQQEDAQSPEANSKDTD